MAELETFGLKWPAGTTQLQIHIWFIARRGIHTKSTGEVVGLGLSAHLERMRRIIWPELDGEDNGQRWHKLCRDTIAEHKVTCLLGPGSSGKTHEASWIALCMWMCDPANTCVLVSSTDMRGLRLRVWGEISSLWQSAIQRFDFLPGHMLDSKLAITNDAADDDGDYNDRLVRNFRAAIIGIPTVQNGKQVGLGKWIGLKQKHVILVADEAQFMGPSFLSAFANLSKNERFTAIVLGNPNDTLDPLGKAAEPIDGWDGHMEPEKTAVWKTRFMDGACVNLIGTDSPNFDFPADKPTRFKYLISREKIEDTAKFFAKDSFEYYSQCIGAMKISSLSRRVLTRRMCEDGHALDVDVNWEGSPRTRVYFVDAGYGGDRCVGGWGEFGRVVSGQIVLLLHPPTIIPVSARVEKEPEQQIAEYVKRECEGLNIPPLNMGHDATGRGSLGTFIARVWSADTQPIEAGGQPTDRPVSLDIFTWEKSRAAFPVLMKRLKLCKEHYVKRVTEYWYTVRYAVQAGQVRGMTSDTMEEFCQRNWERVKDDKIELETKDKMKERIGRSPDLADWACFLGDTLILTTTGMKRIDSLQIGDRIVTPFGATDIVRTACRYVAEITVVKFSNGETLSGTKDHKIFTWNGWCSMDALSLTPVLESVLNLPLWRFRNLFCAKDESMSFKHLVDTIKTRTGTVSRRDFYTGLFGLNSAAQFLRECVSTIRMAIGRTIALAISNCLRVARTDGFILGTVGVMPRTESECWQDYGKEIERRERGTARHAAGHGTLKIAGSNGSSGKLKTSSAPSAGKALSPSTVEKFCFVQRDAWINGAIEMRNWCREFARCAPRALWLILAGPHRIAAETVQRSQSPDLKPVYDITLRDHNVYFANGILVSNCGVVEMARRRGFTITKLANEGEQRNSLAWFHQLADRQRELAKARELVSV